MYNVGYTRKSEKSVSRTFRAEEGKKKERKKLFSSTMLFDSLENN